LDCQVVILALLIAILPLVTLILHFVAVMGFIAADSLKYFDIGLSLCIACGSIHLFTTDSVLGTFLYVHCRALVRM